MRKIMISAVIVMSVAANAQVKETSTGVMYDSSSNLVFKNKSVQKGLVVEEKKVSTDMVVGGLYSNLSGNHSWGLNMEVDGLYQKKPAFAWVLGAGGTLTYNKDFGLMTDFNILGGFRVGNRTYFQLTPMIGVGQTPYLDYSSQKDNPQNFNEYRNTSWSLKGGAQASLGIPLGKKVGLRFDLRYQYALCTGDRTYNEADNWCHQPTEYSKGNLSAAVSLAIPVAAAKQESGDHDWYLALNTGYSCVGSKGFMLEAEAFHVDRKSGYTGLVLGGGLGQIIHGSTSYGSVFGKIGCQIYPLGSDSWMVLEGGLKPGIGEFSREEVFYTQEGTYSLTGEAKNIGVFGKGYLSVIARFGKNAIRISGEGGVGTTFKTTAEDVPGSAVHIDSGSSNRFKKCAAVTFSYIRRI